MKNSVSAELQGSRVGQDLNVQKVLQFFRIRLQVNVSICSNSLPAFEPDPKLVGVSGKTPID